MINDDNDGYTWSQANTYITPAHSGTYAAQGMGNNDDHLITPLIYLPLCTNMRMKVWY